MSISLPQVLRKKIQSHLYQHRSRSICGPDIPGYEELGGGLEQEVPRDKLCVSPGRGARSLGHACAL